MNQANAIQVYEPTINLPILVDKSEVMEIVKENLEGITPEFTRVKFPSGGGLVFELPGEDGEPEPVKEIQGVIIDHYPTNAYYKEKFDGSNNPPDCASLDGKVGFAPANSPVPWAGSCQDCASCPFNQFGTATDQNGNATNGKACRNQQRVFLLPEGQIFPLIITVPPTSRKAFTTYLVGLTSRAKPYTGVVTSIKLKKEQSGGGIAYSAGVFGKAKDLAATEARSLKEYANELRVHTRRVAVDAGEVSDARVNDSGRPIDISDEELY